MFAHSRQSGTETTPTVIAPRRPGAAIDLRELWAFRELGYFFIWRDVKVRYKQTLFGVLWAIVQPLALTIVFALFLGRLSNIAPPSVPYALFALTALVPWTLFSRAIIACSDSLVNSANLIQKIYFPRLLLPVSAVGLPALDFVIAMIVLLGATMYFAIDLRPAVILLVPLTALAIIAALGFGVWLAAINVRYRDVRHVVPLLVQTWLFVSPVAYSSQLVPDEWRLLYQFNPLVGVIEGFRWAVLGVGSMPPLGPILTASVVSILVLLSGLVYFYRTERTFADVI